MENKTPAERAKEIHNQIQNPIARNLSTIAVMNTEENSVIVGTSEKRLRAEQREVLTENEIEAKSISGDHAEQNVINEAKERNLKGTEIGVSRPICLECEELIKQEGIETKTEFSGKKSKNRI